LLLLGSVGSQAEANSSEELTTVFGCIERSQQNYLIVDKQGSSYILAGVGDQLDGEVGHTLEVKGTLIKTALKQSRKSDDSASIPKGSLRVGNVLDDVHRVGDHCPDR
jgi:hypothetical protein